MTSYQPFNVDVMKSALTQKTYMVGVHRYAYRAGEPAEILELKWVKPNAIGDPKHQWRLAFLVQFDDGKQDYVAFSDVLAGNQVIISDVDLINGHIPEIVN
jgi:hypothetical protein